MPQTTVTSDPAQALPGLLYDAERGDVMSVQADDPTIAPGLMVVRAAAGDFAAEAPAATFTAASKALGIVLRSQKALATSPASADNEKYEDGDEMPVLRHGRAWVTVEDAFTTASAVFVRFASGGGGSTLGAFRTDADTATAVAVTECKFLTSGGAGELGLVEINL